MEGPLQEKEIQITKGYASQRSCAAHEQSARFVIVGHPYLTSMVCLLLCSTLDVGLPRSADSAPGGGFPRFFISLMRVGQVGHVLLLVQSFIGSNTTKTNRMMIDRQLPSHWD
jgi:hypothetical protein